MDDGKIMRNHCLAQENTLVMKRALPIDLIIASKKNKHAGKKYRSYINLITSIMHPHVTNSLCVLMTYYIWINQCMIIGLKLHNAHQSAQRTLLNSAQFLRRKGWSADIAQWTREAEDCAAAFGGSAVHVCFMCKQVANNWWKATDLPKQHTLLHLPTRLGRKCYQVLRTILLVRPKMMDWVELRSQRN